MKYWHKGTNHELNNLTPPPRADCGTNGGGKCSDFVVEAIAVKKAASMLNPVSSQVLIPQRVGLFS